MRRSLQPGSRCQTALWSGSLGLLILTRRRSLTRALERYDGHLGERDMLRGLAVIAAACSAFFAFYTIRLLAVTGFLQRTRPGGGGAYVGAMVFPLLALVFAWAAVRAWRGSGRVRGRPV